MAFRKKMKLAIQAAFSEHRGELMGFAALWIGLMHAVSELFPYLHIPVLGAILERGNLGVEIFLALSGYGLFCALEGNPDTRRFYRRRLSRLIGPWLVLGLVYWMIFSALKGELGLWSLVGNLLGISFWTSGVTTIWYVSYIVLLYLLYPMLYRLQKKNAELLLLLSGLVILLNLLLWKYASPFYENTEIAITRTPVFLMGSYIAQFVHTPDRESKKAPLWVLSYVLLGSVAFAGSLFLLPRHRDAAIMLYRYGGGGAMLLLMAVMGKFLSLVKGTFLKKILSFYGEISLEFYLLDVFIRNFAGHWLDERVLPGAVCIAISGSILIVSTLFAKASNKWFKKIKL